MSTAEQRLGPYSLVEEVGYGGMGTVFLARREGPRGFRKAVALKVIHPHLAKQDEFVTMFLDEARIAAAMSHPNVAQVHELGEEDSGLFLAMEYLHGEPLSALMECGHAIAPAVAASIVIGAARGLHHAHEAKGEDGNPLGLVHRDVSPQNIFVTFDGHVKVTDFGIAKAEGRLAKATQTGRIKGKCAYLAPEQTHGGTIDRRSDVFALGIVLWELLAGERLFRADTDAETLMRIVDHDVPPLTGIDPQLASIAETALAALPEERFDSAEAFANALENWGRATGAAELRRFMENAFGPELQAKEALLRKARESSPLRLSETPASVEGVPPQTTEAPERVASEHAAPGRVATERAVPEHTAPVVLPQNRLPRILIAAFIAIAGVAGGAWLWNSQQPSATLSQTEVGSVRVQTNPAGAELRLDGEVMAGTTPVVLPRVPWGRHQLQVALPGFEPFQATFDLDRPELELSYRLAEQNESPAADEVAVPQQGTQGAVSPEETLEETSAPSPGHAASNTARGPSTTMRAPQRQAAPHPQAAPQPRATQTPQAQPTPQPASAQANTEPAAPGQLNLTTVPWSQVRINGEDLGRTPLFRREVPAGPLRIELLPEGQGTPIVRRLVVEPGQTVSRRWEL